MLQDFFSPAWHKLEMLWAFINKISIRSSDDWSTLEQAILYKRETNSFPLLEWMK